MKINMNAVKGIAMGTVAGIALGTALSIAFDIPEVHTSHSTGECVRVLNFHEEHTFTCENLPPRYSNVWVKQMIRILKETTDWGAENISNGTYYVNEHGHLVAYMPHLGAYKEFTKPMKQFSTSRRNFKELGTIDDGDSGTPVKGSKGNTYYVKDGKCTCPGFKFRHKCKHLLEVAA